MAKTISELKSWLAKQIKIQRELAREPHSSGGREWRDGVVAGLKAVMKEIKP